MLGDVPAIHLPFQVDVGDQRAVLAVVGFQQGHGLLSGRRDDRLEAAVMQRVRDETLEQLLVFDDKDDRHFNFRHDAIPRCSPRDKLQSEHRFPARSTINSSSRQGTRLSENRCAPHPDP